MPYFHLVARNARPLTPFFDRDACADLWARLRDRFPQVLACVLMPNHVHQVVDAPDGREARRAFVAGLSGLAKSRFPGRRIWGPIPDVEEISDALHLLRQVRYVHLNPCRARLVADPLEWEWSTHRDAVGAAASCWLDIPTLAKAMKTDLRRFPAEFHRYVSGDPTVRIEGTLLPSKPDGAEGLVTTFQQMEWAVLQATRAGGDLRKRGNPARRALIQLADRLGCSRRVRIAEWVGVSDRSVRAVLAERVTPSDEAALRSAVFLLSARERFARPRARLLPYSGG